MIQKVVQSFGSLTMIRILSRVFEFLLKTYLIRNLLDKQIVGHMLQLDLIVTTSLHIIKSCLKPAYQKVTDPNKTSRNIISGMNLMNFGITIAGISSCIVCIFQLYHYEHLQQEKRLVNLNYAIILYGIGALSEACFEKYNVRNVLRYDYMKSAIIEMSSFLPKTLFIFIAAQLSMFQTYGILVFGMGYLLYTFLLFLISYFTTPKQQRHITFVTLPQQNQTQLTYIDPKTKQSAKEFLSLSILKLGVQQFEKIVLVALDISSFSSIYTLISNLGSIVVRYIFAPLEQVVYNYFTRGDQKESVKTLILLVKSILLFSCLSLTFGYNFSQSFLGFLYGQKWVSPESVQALQIYTLLLSVLGINGIMEAFLFAKAGKEFKLYKYVSLIPTAIYIFLSFYFINFLNLGTGSFFLANTISMMIRILISWNMEVKKHISLRQFILAIKPSYLFLLSLIVTFFLGHSRVGIQRFNHYFKDMILGGMLFLINLAVIMFQNRQFIKQKVKRVLNKQEKTQ